MKFYIYLFNLNISKIISLILCGISFALAKTYNIQYNKIIPNGQMSYVTLYSVDTWGR